jgi:phosphohistidine phosphatase
MRAIARAAAPPHILGRRDTMMLYLVRHAWAGESGDPRYSNDDLRPLTREGRRRFRRFVGRLAERGLEVERIATSPLVRCRQTADLLEESQAGRPAVVELAALAPGANLEDLIAWTASGGVGDVAWVGHAPDVGLLAAALLGAPAGALRFGKGMVAAVQFTGLVQAGGGVLRWLASAKLLGL